MSKRNARNVSDEFSTYSMFWLHLLKNVGVFCFLYWKDFVVFWLIGLVLWCAGQCCLHTIVLFSSYCVPYGPETEHKE